MTAKGLLAPSGTMPMLMSLAKTLFQVRPLLHTPLQTLNGIHVVAFLLQELEIMTIAKVLSAIVLRELTPLINGLQINFRENTEKVTGELQEKATEMIERTKVSIEEIGKVT